MKWSVLFLKFVEMGLMVRVRDSDKDRVRDRDG